jgi:hypothetical protein
MINIISTQVAERNITGPQKVFANLIKGLDRIGYPYVVNRNLRATKRLWIQDDVRALRFLNKTRAKTVVGPNTFGRPRNIPREIDLSEVIYLQPCMWAKEMWEEQSDGSYPVRVWPVGIDTDMFCPGKGPSFRKSIMLYHKRRDPGELNYIIKTLESMNLQYNLLICYQYDEMDYLDLLRNRTSFIIWHGRAESQGVAFQEAMACDVPILVCDVTKASQETGIEWDGSEDHIRVTAAPYFDDTCGIKIIDLNQLNKSVVYMFDNLEKFAPREFVLKNLSLEGQARKLVEFWQYWDLSFEKGLYENLGERGKWPPIHQRVWKKTRPVLRKIKRAIT